jgi:hypothetical protein
MLEFCPAESSARPWSRVRLSLNYVLGCFDELLVKLCRMISLHKTRGQLLWNDALVKRVGGTPLLKRRFNFRGICIWIQPANLVSG